MPGNKPKPQNKTKLRIDKDKREFNRLDKILKKLLVEGHSPILYDYLDYQFDRIEDPVGDAEFIVNNNAEVAVLDMDYYFTDAEKELLETVDLWSKEHQQILKNAEERSFAWVGNVETGAMEYIYRGGDMIGDGYKGMAGETTREIDKGEEVIIVTLDDEEEEIKDEEERAEQNGPGFWGSLWDATVGLPEVLVNIGKLIDGFVNMDPEKFIEDNIEMTKTVKRLQNRLAEHPELLEIEEK